MPPEASAVLARVAYFGELGPFLADPARATIIGCAPAPPQGPVNIVIERHGYRPGNVAPHKAISAGPALATTRLLPRQVRHARL